MYRADLRFLGRENESLFNFSLFDASALRTVVSVVL